MNDKLNAHHAENYRLLQAEAQLELYRDDNGHDADNIKSLEQWFVVNDECITARFGKPIDPYKVLSKDQIRATLKDRNLIGL